MKLIATVTALCLLAGCASPPKPAQCKGEFRPVNQTDGTSAALGQSDQLALCTVEVGHEQS